jgi:putative DNA primase/helicase
MKVKYNANAPQPERRLRFLSELLASEDIPTLQEYLGYCMIPSAKGQKSCSLNKAAKGKAVLGL